MRFRVFWTVFGFFRFFIFVKKSKVNIFIKISHLRHTYISRVLNYLNYWNYCPVRRSACQAVKLAAFDAIELLAEDPAHGAARRQRSRRAETVADRRNVAALGRTAAHGASSCRRYAPHGCGDCRQFRYFK